MNNFITTRKEIVLEINNGQLTGDSSNHNYINIYVLNAMEQLRNGQIYVLINRNFSK